VAAFCFGRLRLFDIRVLVHLQDRHILQVEDARVSKFSDGNRIGKNVAPERIRPTNLLTRSQKTFPREFFVRADEKFLELESAIRAAERAKDCESA